MARKTKPPAPKTPVLQVTAHYMAGKGKKKHPEEHVFPQMPISNLDRLMDLGAEPWVDKVKEQTGSRPYKAAAKLHTYTPVWNGAMWVQVPRSHEVWTWDAWGRGDVMDEDAWVVHRYSSTSRRGKSMSEPMPLEEAMDVIDFLVEDQSGFYEVFPADE